MALIAASHLRDLSGTNATRPQVFECREGDDSSRWVLKLGGNPLPELIADWVGSLAAHYVGIRCPEVQIVDVPDSAIATAPADVADWALPGPAFGSREMMRVADELADQDVVELCDAKFLGALYAIDTWLEVLDRRKPEGAWNLLINSQDGLAYAIDFGKSLSPALFPGILDPSKVVVPGYPGPVRAKASRPEALDTCTKIEGIAPVELRQIVDSIPAGWADHLARNRVVDFLSGRQGLVRDVCDKMYDGTSQW